MKEQIRNILQNEIKYHSEEMTKHYELSISRPSKKEARKVRKHFHKRFQTIKIANKLGLKLCKYCGSLK